MLLKLPADIRSRAITEIAQGLFAAIIGAVIFVNLPENSSTFVQLLVIGFLLSGCFLALFRPRWYLRADWVLNNAAPVAAIITLRTIADNENKQLWAEINISEAVPANTIIAGRSLKVAVWPPADGLIEAVNKPRKASVYFDPNPQGPTVIKMDNSVLWPVLISVDE
jgi:hypothetical protein